MNGQIVYYNEVDFRGVIQGEDGIDYKFDAPHITFSPFKVLFKGMDVEFDGEYSRIGYRAKEIIVLESPATRTIRPNPFTPQRPTTDPARFAGRGDIIFGAVDALFNHRNLLITGERGVGKSSLAYQLGLVAEGQSEMIRHLEVNLDAFTFDYLVARHSCIQENTLADVLSSLIADLYKAANVSQVTRKKVKDEVQFHAGPVKLVHSEERERIETAELGRRFYSAVESIFSEVNTTFNGICFIIDEVDRLSPGIRLASILRSVHELFVYSGYENISFVLVGIEGSESIMQAEHPSLRRWFELVEVPLMDPRELEEIIYRALAGYGVRIGESVARRMISLAAGFPEPIHLVGYHTYRFDGDAYLDIEDLRKGEDYVIKHVRRTEFRNLHDGARRSDLAQQIMWYMAEIEDENVELARLSKEWNINKSYLGNATAILVQDGIAIKVSNGVYKLREPLFKVYLRWARAVE
jgi:predicted transcriptional regulator